MEDKITKWQILYIDDVKYIVLNMIEYREGSWEELWVWQEYEICGEKRRS